MLRPLEGFCQIILEHMFRLCCWRAPNTHEMSIKLVRAARVTDTTGALLGESRGHRRPRNTVKNDVFEHPAQKT